MSATWKANVKNVMGRSAPPIRLIIMDVDGSGFQTYWTLEAFKEHTKLSSGSHNPEDHRTAFHKAVAYVKEKDLIQHILHEPNEALERIERAVFGTDFHHKHPDVQTRIENSFALYPGAKEVLEKAEEAGTAVDLYTNTSSINMLKKLRKACIDPKRFYAIYSLVEENDHDSLNDWKNEYADKRLAKIRLYTKSKPNPGPVKALLEELGISHNETLLIGDSVHDLLCCDGGKNARFGYLENNARELDRRVVPINEALRENALGHEHVMKACPGLAKHSWVTVLSEGFESFLKMIEREENVLGNTFKDALYVRPGFTPAVSSSSLIS